MKSHRGKRGTPVDASGIESQYIAWVKLMLAKMRRKGLLPLFEHILKLQLSGRTGKGGVDRRSLAMVANGASSNGAFTQEQQSAYDSDPQKAAKEHRIAIYVARLAKLLAELNPPGHANPIFLEREGQCCWLTGLRVPSLGEGMENEERFRHWCCSIDGTKISGPIHLPVKPARKIHPKLTILGDWKPPKHFPNYTQFKQARWNQFHGKELRSHDSPTLFFSDIKSKGNVVEIFAEKGEYSNYVATINSLSESISVHNGQKRKVAQLLAIGWNSRSKMLPLAVASPVSLDLMIVSKQGTVLACDYKRSRCWTVSVSVVPNLVYDGYNTDPTGIINQAIYRRTYEELGLFIEPQRILWLAFGVGRISGHTALIGQIVLPKTENEIRQRFEYRKDRDEVGKIEFIPLEIEAVQKFLNTQDCRHFFRLSLFLCLWRKFPTRVKFL